MAEPTPEEVKERVKVRKRTAATAGLRAGDGGWVCCCGSSMRQGRLYSFFQQKWLNYVFSFLKNPNRNPSSTASELSRNVPGMFWCGLPTIVSVEAGSCRK